MRENRRLFLGDVLLAEVPSRGNGWSYALFCPDCGKLWGRLESSSGSRKWSPLTRTCPEYAGDEWDGDLPGTFFGSFKWYDEQEVRGILLANPLLLKHEFYMALNWRKREKA